MKDFPPAGSPPMCPASPNDKLPSVRSGPGTRKATSGRSWQTRPLRVMHIITRLIIGGAQENTLLTVEDLIRDFGDTVLLVTGPAPGPEGDLFDRVQQRGTPCVVVDELQRAIHPARDVLAYRRLLALIRQWQPDVVHTHSSKAGILGRLAADAAGVPAVVHTVHGSPFHPFERPWRNLFYRWAERMAARRCDGLIAVSHAMRDLYLSHGIGVPERFEVIYSGMEVDEFVRDRPEAAALRERLGIRPDEVVIGKVARLFHLKGHEFVLAAAPRVVAEVPNVKFLFVGDGILRDQLRRTVAELGVADRFVFAGLVPPADIPVYLQAMDIVVHCSLREGLARVLAQAKLAGKPVVCFRLDGAWEVIEDGRSGFLVRPRDADELADRLIRLARAPELRRRMGAADAEALRARFDHHRMTSQIRAFYERLLEQEGTRNPAAAATTAGPSVHRARRR